MEDGQREREEAGLRGFRVAVDVLERRWLLMWKLARRAAKRQQAERERAREQ